MKQRTKRIMLITFSVSLCIIFIMLLETINEPVDNDILNNLDGDIFYTKRVNGVLTLFKSKASMDDEELLYSHVGRGNDSYGGFNDNILDFFYDKESQSCTFIAMSNGEWCKFRLDTNSGEVELIELLQADDFWKSNVVGSQYLKKSYSEMVVREKEGSLYLSVNGKEKCIKKYRGVYDSKFTGYRFLGFSPDKRYVVYNSMEHLTPLGTIIDNILTEKFGGNYIYEIETGKSAKYIESLKIQWIMNE